MSADSKVPAESSNRLAFVFYLVFIVSWFLHLGARAPVLGAIRFDVWLLLFMTLLSIGAGRRDSDTAPQESGRWLLIVVAYALLTVPLVEWPGSVLSYGLGAFLKAALYYFFTTRLVTSSKRLAWLLGVFLACQMFRVIEPVYLHVTEGYWGSRASMADWESMDRLAGAPLDVINPNGLAFVVVTALAFIHFLGPLTKIGTIVYALFLPAAFYALALTASRTGLLAVAIVGAGIWLKSRRKLVATAAMVGAVFVAVPLFSDNLRDRYLSILSSETKNAATASERTEGIRVGIEVAMRRPLFGHGLGTSREANANFGIADQPAHNLYVEVMQELGLIGVVLYLGFLRALVVDIRRTTRAVKTDGPATLVTRTMDALHLWLIMNLAFSVASFGLSGYEWYLMAGLSAAVARLCAASAERRDALAGVNLTSIDRPPAFVPSLAGG